MLEVKNVAVSYGRHRALEGVNLRVAKGEICVILGANGAGKSTLLKTIAGMVHAEPGGEITMNGKPITAMKAHKIVEEGIALVPEGRGIFGDLTVAENLQLGAFANRARAREATSLAEIYQLFPRLAERKGQIARTMSGGEQQMVAIGRALMSRPEILMLDEPSLGLSPLLSKELFRSLAQVAKTGVGILLVEQNAKQSLKIAERGYLIENGHVTGENTAQALMNDPAVISAYLGGATTSAAPKQERSGPRFVLPSFLRLPLDVAGIGRSISELASRAGRIQQAFIRVLRRETIPPSAFVGRYDQKSGGDPWADIAAATPRPASAAAAPVVSSDARKLGSSASSLAQRAGDRHAAHIASKRLSASRPSAFIAQQPSLEPVIRPLHRPAVVEPEAPMPVDNTAHGLLGHNSAGFVPDDEPVKDESVVDVKHEEQAAQHAPQAQALSITDLAARAGAIHAAHVARNRKPLSVAAPVDVWTPSIPSVKPRTDAISDLVARASAIQAAHISDQRKRLTAYTIPIQSASKPDKDDTAKKKRKKHKEA